MAKVADCVNNVISRATTLWLKMSSEVLVKSLFHCSAPVVLIEQSLMLRWTQKSCLFIWVVVWQG